MNKDTEGGEKKRQHEVQRVTWEIKNMVKQKVNERMIYYRKRRDENRKRGKIRCKEKTRKINKKIERIIEG